MNVKATIKDNHLTLTINNKVVRDLDIIENNPYQFKYKKEDCSFIVESKYERKTLYLYPINFFKPNKIEL